jgi:type IX secretion system PorP/SprF family membrane protein
MSFYSKTLVAFTLLLSNAHAQDARLSQPWSNPTMMNPAMSGNFDGLLKLGLGSSWQSNGSNKVAHQYAFVDKRIDLPEYSPNKFIGLSINAYQYGKDLIGGTPNNSPIHASFISFTGAYHFNLFMDETHSMGVGAQAVLANGNLDERKGAYDKEISGSGFEWTQLDKMGTTVREGASYADVNAGAYYRYRGNGMKAEIGTAVYHFLNPDNAIKTNTGGGQHSRAVFHAKLEVDLNKTHSLTLRYINWEEGLYWRSYEFSASNIHTSWTGAELANTASNRKLLVSGGLYTRSFRTIMPLVNININRAINISTSYEMPLSPARYGSYTAKRFEISLHFKRFDPDWEY